MLPMRLIVSLTTCVVCTMLLGTARAVTLTFTDVDPYGIQYFASVTPVSGSLYDVSFTINTAGYTGTQDAWLDWVNLKISPHNPASVSNLNLPTGWSYTGSQAGKVTLESAVVNAPPDASDIYIPVSGSKPTVTFSYRVDLTGTSLKTDEWPYQARYLFKTNKPDKYNQTIVSRELRPQGGVIPEPTTLLLFGMGVAAPLALRRRT
ncbi:MAG: PEP-CTERM sorting domain-containing protein [Armatimonadota bacterium]